MPKVRCTVCTKYIDRTTVYRKVGFSALCSPECLMALRRHTEEKARQHQRKVSKRKSEGDIAAGVRQEVLIRDHFHCRYCGTVNDLHLHHVVYRSQGGPGEPWNLLTLCGDHHALVHSDKRRYMPLCRGVIWMTYQKRASIRIPQLERWLEREAEKEQGACQDVQPELVPGRGGL